mgnify:FL=1
MLPRILGLLLVIFLSVFSQTASSDTPSGASQLSDAERQWLATHPNIQLVSHSRAPLSRKTAIILSTVAFFVTIITAIWILTLYKAKEKLRVSESKIRQHASFDSLTGLYNRHKFYEILREEIDQASDNGEIFALLFLDLDEFKEVNDTLGHSVGDALLRRVANRLKNRVRSRDIVARLGGD